MSADVADTEPVVCADASGRPGRSPVPDPAQPEATAAEGALDVVAVGSALVDALVHATDDDLKAHDLVRGTMTLVDHQRAHALYAGSSPAQVTSGGSAANTVVGVAALGGRAGFVGRTAADDLGELFRSDLARAGVRVGQGGHGPLVDGTGITGRCMVYVTADGERTMATHLGVASFLAPDDLDQGLLSAAQVVYLEGYLWDLPPAKAALHRAIEVAHASDGLVALTVSDPFCVERHRRAFLDLIRDDVDILFANEEEARSLFGATDTRRALAALEDTGVLAAVTRGAAGSTVVTPGGAVDVPADPVTVVDTTGAGDLYAAGFLYGLTHGAAPEQCARLGAACAAEVISHLGARPQADLRPLVAGIGHSSTSGSGGR